jgi:hypothetical protein
MSYLATSGVIDKIGEGITKAAGVVTQYGQIKAAIASGQQPAAPPDEGFDWTPILLLGGIGVAAYFLLRKKK